MTARNILFLMAAVVLAAATWFGVRQRQLNSLRAGNETLRREAESCCDVAAATNTSTDAAPAEAATELTAEERNELLRLRSQVPLLRRDVAIASNRIAALERPAARSAPNNSGTGPTPADDPIRSFMQSEPVRAANEVSGALKVYLRQHGGQVPESLAALRNAGGATFSDDIAGRFELVRTSAVPDDPALAPYVIIAHEKKARQLSDGRWVRIYLQANGGLTMAGPLPMEPSGEDSDFIRNAEEWGRKKVLEQKTSPAK